MTRDAVRLSPYEDLAKLLANMDGLLNKGESSGGMGHPKNKKEDQFAETKMKKSFNGLFEIIGKVEKTVPKVSERTAAKLITQAQRELEKSTKEYMQGSTDIYKWATIMLGAGAKDVDKSEKKGGKTLKRSETTSPERVPVKKNLKKQDKTKRVVSTPIESGSSSRKSNSDRDDSSSSQGSESSADRKNDSIAKIYAERPSYKVSLDVYHDYRNRPVDKVQVGKNEPTPETSLQPRGTYKAFDADDGEENKIRYTYKDSESGQDKKHSGKQTTDQAQGNENSSSS